MIAGKQVKTSDWRIILTFQKPGRTLRRASTKRHTSQTWSRAKALNQSNCTFGVQRQLCALIRHKDVFVLASICSILSALSDTQAPAAVLFARGLHCSKPLSHFHQLKAAWPTLIPRGPWHTSFLFPCLLFRCSKRCLGADFGNRLRFMTKQ